MLHFFSENTFSFMYQQKLKSNMIEVKKYFLEKFKYFFKLYYFAGLSLVKTSQYFLQNYHFFKAIQADFLKLFFNVSFLPNI